MKSEYTVNDKLDHLTVLYHRGCKQGFKFFGDDPEEKKEYITDEHVGLLKEVHTNYNEFPYEFITKFYAHSRCLVFPDGMWMSETARHPQYLRYKPGSYCNFRVSGLTRFTSLTENASALCVGINPNDGEIPCYRRIVHNIDVNTVFQPMYTDSYLIPTRDCTYGSTVVKRR